MMILDAFEEPLVEGPGTTWFFVWTVYSHREYVIFTEP